MGIFDHRFFRKTYRRSKFFRTVNAVIHPFDHFFGPKLWWFRFSAEPLPKSPDHGHFSDGYIEVWVSKTEGVMAEKIARDAIAKTEWKAVRLARQEYGNQRICHDLPQNLEHFQRAVRNGYSVDVHRCVYPEDEDNGGEAPAKEARAPETQLEAGIHVATKTNTGADGITRTLEIFTRDGQKRLQRVTNMQGTRLLLRIQTFYHNGEEVAAFLQRDDPRSESFTTSATSCQIALDFSLSEKIERLFIFRNGEGPAEAFIFKGGVFQLMTDSELRALMGK